MDQVLSSDFSQIVFECYCNSSWAPRSGCPPRTTRAGVKVEVSHLTNGKMKGSRRSGHTLSSIRTKQGDREGHIHNLTDTTVYPRTLKNQKRKLKKVLRKRRKSIRRFLAEISEKELRVPVLGHKSDSDKMTLESRETMAKEGGSDADHGGRGEVIKLSDDSDDTYLIS